VTISSGLGIDKKQDKAAIYAAAAGDGEGALGIFEGADKKELAAISGLPTDNFGSRVGDWLGEIVALADELWDGGAVDVSEEPSSFKYGNADRCRYHAEQKVVKEAGGTWEILGIGASHKVCLNCEFAIKNNSPAAIIVPMGGVSSCIPPRLPPP
jgi:hypothetical protein